MDILIAILAAGSGFAAGKFVFGRKRAQQITTEATHITLIPSASILEPKELGHNSADSGLWYLCGDSILCSASAEPVNHPLPAFDIVIERIGPSSVLLSTGQRFDLSIRVELLLKAAMLEQRQKDTQRLWTSTFQQFPPTEWLQDTATSSALESWINANLPTILHHIIADTHVNQENNNDTTDTANTQKVVAGEFSVQLQQLLSTALSSVSDPGSILTVLTSRNLVVDLSPTEEIFYTGSVKEQQFLLLDARRKQQLLEERLEIEERKTLLNSQNTQLRREQEMIEAFAEELERHRSEIDLTATQVDSKTQQLRDRITQQLDGLQSQIHAQMDILRSDLNRTFGQLRSDAVRTAAARGQNPPNRFISSAQRERNRLQGSLDSNKRRLLTEAARLRQEMQELLNHRSDGPAVSNQDLDISAEELDFTPEERSSETPAHSPQDSHDANGT